MLHLLNAVEEKDVYGFVPVWLDANANADANVADTESIPV